VVLQFGGTAAIAQCTAGNVAGGQIEPVAVQHWLFILFKLRVIFLTKTAVKR
jgi:hypothetical protein